MKNSYYSYLCSKSILKMIAELSNDSSIMSLYDNYSRNFDDKDDVNVIWMLISTSLLMSEGLFKNNRAYNYISEETVSEIEEKLFYFDRLIPGEAFSYPCLLNSLNQAALPFRDFLVSPNNESDDYSYLDKKEEFSHEYVKYLKDEYNSLNYNDINLIDGPYGCNESIITNGLIDIKKLIIKVRNAIAHSTYDIIDNDNVRLYHYNSGKKKYDFNIILDNNTIINILDELNEIAYKKYIDFKVLHESDNYIDNKLASKKDSCDEDFINYILSFGVCDVEVAKKIYNEAIQSDLYRGITTTREKKQQNINKMVVIVEFMFDYIKPYCDFGIIINDIMYVNDKGAIDSDHLYRKIDTYEYLKSDFYGSNYSMIDDEIFRENKLNLLILSFLNCCLLTTHNQFENNNKEYLKLDFSSMDIDKYFVEYFTLKHINANMALVDKFNNRLLKIEEEIVRLNNLLNIRKDVLLTKYINNEYFNVTLPEQIDKINLDILRLNKEKDDIYIKINEIDGNERDYNYDIELSKFIFNALRNSLAHGYVKIYKNSNNIYDLEIIFEDYKPDNRSELTFKGKIRFGDLLKIFTNNEIIESLYGCEKINKLKKK